MVIVRILVAVNIFLFCSFNFEFTPDGTLTSLEETNTNFQPGRILNDKGGEELGGDGNSNESDSDSDNGGGEPPRSVDGEKDVAPKRRQEKEDKKDAPAEGEEKTGNDKVEPSEPDASKAGLDEKSGEQNAVSDDDRLKTLDGGNNADGKLKEGEDADNAGDRGDSSGNGDDEMKSKMSDAHISEHKSDADGAKKDGEDEAKNGESGATKKGEGEEREDDSEEDDDSSTPYLDKLDDKVAHYSALRNNRIEKDVTDTMVLSDIIGNENMKSCSQNNGGCADDQICIRIDKIGIKCICKEGHLFGGKCILANSSALSPAFSISIPFLMVLLLMF
ncbi:merozoite surface protein 5, putative [Plasmodium ovale]|uniref:Merozoite surface protein 5, putative n=1 Tax=Plasmodium ovale TaxID=36330 RepID=A0A1D3RDI3_PLAOA|nr:merozoite surface protein 5, putative [Plasmodium ovale]